MAQGDPVIYYAPSPFPKRLDQQFHFDSKTPVHNNLNSMLSAIEARLAKLDSLFVTQEQVIDKLIEVGLQRMDEVFTPLINAAVERLNTLGVQFSAPSTTTNTIGTGTKSFTIPSPQRDAYIYGSHVNIRFDAANFMVASVTSYDRATGVLVVESIFTSGSGSYSNWTINLTAAPDITHATRQDNPHHVTAAQVGAYDIAAIDFRYTSLINSLLSMSGNLIELTDPRAARTNLGLGDAATKFTGVGPSQVPLNSNLGSAAYRNVGLLENYVPALGYNGIIPATTTGVGFVPEGRLTLEPGVPVQINRNLGPKTVINYAPYLGKHVPIWNGSNWMMWPILSPTDAVGLVFDMGANPYWPANKNYDLFIGYLASTQSIYLGTGPAWQTDLLRGVGAGTSEIEMWHGLPVNKYPFAQFASAHGIDVNMPARSCFWVGTFRTSANGTTRMDFTPGAADGGSHPKLFLWNRYHKLATMAKCTDSTGNWLVPLGSIQVFGSMQRVNQSVNNRISWVVGEGSSRFIATMNELVGVSQTFRTQIGYDETEPATVGGLVAFGGTIPAGFVLSSNLFCEMRRTSDAGFHFVQFCEQAVTTAVNVQGANFSGALTMDM
jgi:hypothetical protein